MTDIAEALKAAGVKARALEWECGEGEIVSGDYVVAATFGTWRVWFQFDPLRDARGRPVDHVDKNAAIAAANSHNEARILAALTTGDQK